MVLVDIYWQDKLSRKQDSTLVSQKTDETDMQPGMESYRDALWNYGTPKYKIQ